MSQYKLFPRLARRSASLFFVCSLSFIFLATAATTSFAQSRQGRPVARLITATSEPYEGQPMQANHRVVVRQPLVVASSAPPVAASSLERKAFDAVNAERMRYGLPPLAWDGDLLRMARLHSEKMARLNFFDHEGPDGDLPTRARQSGVRWRSLAENIALNQGYSDPVALAVEQWMHSAGHRDNILRGIFTHSAIGIARSSDGKIYLTQVFIMR
ncbi:MAG TPA: CAP domain-containing protein [Pyrinomonadaceae bacterium]|nr:CAP domain-containing protein [Pyrinomonadaceae bacterium]